MSLIGNVIWIILGGLPLALLWMITGLLWAVTIIGIPIARQCFKLARLQLAPFGKRITYANSSPFGLVANVVWIVLGGLELAIANVIVGLAYAVTIIGLPLAKQSFKLAQLSLMPFGAQIGKGR